MHVQVFIIYQLLSAATACHYHIKLIKIFVRFVLRLLRVRK